MKECFGNYMEHLACENHNKCDEQGCFSKTNIDKGLCDCVCKASCHIWRQKCQVDSGHSYKECPFYEHLIGFYNK